MLINVGFQLNSDANEKVAFAISTEDVKIVNPRVDPVDLEIKRLSRPVLMVMRKI